MRDIFSTILRKMLRKRYTKASLAAGIVLLGSAAIILEIAGGPALNALAAGQVTALIGGLVLTSLLAAGALFSLIISRQPSRVILPAAAFAEQGLRLQLVTATLTEDLSSKDHPNAIYELVCLTVKEALQADMAAIFEPRAEGTHLHLTGASLHIEDERQWILPRHGRSEFGTQLSSPNGLIVHDPETLRSSTGGLLGEMAQWHAVASAPLSYPGRPPGALAALYRTERNFTAEEVAFLRSCAGLCAVHLARTRAVQHRALLREAQRIMDSNAAPDTAVQQILQTICNQYDFDLAEYWVVDESHLRLRDHWHSLFLPVHEFLGESRSSGIAMGRGLPGRAWKTAKIQWSYDIPSDPSFSRRKSSRDLGLASAIAVPIPLTLENTSHAVYGVMIFYSDRILNFSPEMLDGLHRTSESLGEWLSRSRRDIQLRDSESHFRSLAAHAFGMVRVGVAILDAENTVVWINQSLADMLGVDPVQAAGQSASRTLVERLAAISPSAGEFSRVLRRSYRRQEYLHRFDFELGPQDGRNSRWLEYSSQPITEGEFKGGRSELYLDITRRRSVESELHRRVRQQETVAALGREALDYDELSRLMQRTTELVTQNLGVGFGKLLFLDHHTNRLRLKAGYGWSGPVIIDDDLTDTDTQHGYALYSSDPVVVEDFEKDQRFRRSNLLKDHDVRSGICAVVPGSERPYGVLAAFSRSPHQFSQHDVAFVQAVANILGDAVTRSQTNAELQQAKRELQSRVRVRTQELEKANRALALEIKERERAEETAKSLLRIAQRLSRTLDVDELMDQLLKEAIALVGAQGGCVGLRRQDEMRVSHCIHEGALIDLPRSWKSGESWAGWVLQHARSYVSTDVSSDPLADHDLVRELNINSLICLPLLDSVNKTTAFIQVHNKEDGAPFSDVDHERLQTLGQIAAISLQNALAFGKLSETEQNLSTSREQLLEAQRIAQIGSWEWDLINDELSWSDELRHIYGVDRESQPSSFDEFLERVHPQDREMVRQVVENAYRDHSPFNFRHRIVTDSGDIRILSARGQINLDKNGKPVSMVGTGQDITASTLMEEALSAQTELYDSLLEAQSDLNMGVIVLEDDRLLYANEALWKLSGYRRSELDQAEQILNLVTVDQVGSLGELLEAQKGSPGTATRSHVSGVLHHKLGHQINVELAVKETSRQDQDRTFIIVRDVTLQKRSAETVQSLLSISQRLNATLELDRILSLLVEEGVQLVDARAGFAALFAKGRVQLTQYSGISPQDSESDEPGLTPAALSALSKQSGVLIGNEAEQSNVRPLVVAESETESFIRVPIRDRREQILAVVELYSKNHGGDFDEEDRKRLEALAQIAAIALQNALAYRQIVESEEALHESRQQIRQFSQRQEEMLEDERQRIAREIHDELGGALTGLKMDIAWIRKNLPGDIDQGSRSAIDDRADQMDRLLSDTITTIRRISADLRPGVLDDLGVIAALEWLVADFNRRTGTPAVLSSNIDELAIDRRKSSSLFRVVQEALTNIARHASASSVEVRVNQRDHVLKIEIDDNGVGFEPAAIPEGETLGMIGMQERVRQMDGTLDIQSQRGSGTCLEVTVPMKPVGDIAEPAHS